LKTRLAIFTSHPIQYQAPWFRAIAASPDIEPKVYFAKVPSAKEQGVGFGIEFSWDLPLTEGYPYTVLSTRLMPDFFPRFTRRVATNVDGELDKFDPHVAMVLGWQELTLVQALFACRRRGVPIIIRGESNSKKARPWTVQTLHKAYIRQVDAAIAIGKSNAAFFEGASLPSSRIASAPYFVDNDFFAERAAAMKGDREALRVGWNIPSSSLCVVFAGKLEPKKRVFDFIEAIRISARANPHIYGLIVGSGVQMSDAERQASGLPITFAGFLNQTEIPKAYVAADVIVLPSDFGETWGLVINEAMSTGLPAIVSERVGCADDLVIDGETGFVTPFADPSAIASAITRLANDREELARLGLAASQHVQESYSLNRAMIGLREAIRIATSNDRH
jgi:glycosyltransferase involved in cell wall biosynthesis